MIEELEPEELGMEAIEYQEPFCCGGKMISIYTYRSAKNGIYRQFICETCKHAELQLIAVPI